MAWWEGGGGSWEGKEVRWWATDRLVRGPTVTLAAFRSLRPCTCWIMADRRGGGVATEGKCGEKTSNCQLESPNTVVSPANRPSGRGDNCAETGAVTAGLLGATSRPPVCGVYQGGLSPSLVVCH